MSDMMCLKCTRHYVGKGWYCWSGNKRSVPHCNNGKPDRDRLLYKAGVVRATIERKLIERGVLNDRR